MDEKEVKSREEVESFLRQFFPKLEVWGIIFLNRDKNQEALAALGIVPSARETIVREIRSDDYVETFLKSSQYGEMWVFGKDFKGKELYIKISLGCPNNKTICISLHEAEDRIRYAFKGKEKNHEN